MKEALAGSQGGPPSLQGTILEASSVLGNEIGANGHKWSPPTATHRQDRRQSAAGILQTKDQGHSWLPHKQTKPFPQAQLLAKDIFRLQLPLLSLQAAESMKRRVATHLTFPFSFHVA